MATQTQVEQAIADALNKGLPGLQVNGNEVNRRTVGGILDAVGDVVYRELKKGEPVTLRGLGRFKIAVRPPQKARMGRNPATGEDMKIKAKPATKRLKVLPAKALKDRLRVK